jgi:DNA helicase-2/ATP-dependent DNA helicase PcrA
VEKSIKKLALMKQINFHQLNAQQQKAVAKISGPSLILAGAGSGKTRVLVFKVINLILQGVSPEKILMITFTNKAANEMKARINQHLQQDLGFVGTFHSFCCLILRHYGSEIKIDPKFIIYDEEDQLSLLKKILKDKKINKYSPAYFLNRISTAKNILISPEKYLEVFSDHQAFITAEIYWQYQKALLKNKALDFDDLLVNTVLLFRQKKEILKKVQQRYLYLLVDEFQDTNYAQYELTKLIGARCKNVTVVGDFSQSIYSWRGADIKNLARFQEDFQNVTFFSLEENYRSTKRILDFAHRIISQNETHPVLRLFTHNDEGDEVTIYQAENEQDEAQFIVDQLFRLSYQGDYSRSAVLYRTNVQSRVIEEALLHVGLPYILIGGTRFYARKEIRDILAYLRLILNFSDTVAQERIKKLGKRRFKIFTDFYRQEKNNLINLTTTQIMDKVLTATKYLQLYNPQLEEDSDRLENIKELKSVANSYPRLQDFLEQVALVEAEYFEGEKKNTSQTGVRLMTLHQAKGLEFDYVFVVGVEEGLLPHSHCLEDPFQLEEERRLFYVGITRAKKQLFITYTKRRFIFGRCSETVRSRFLVPQKEDNNW